MTRGFLLLLAMLLTWAATPQAQDTRAFYLAPYVGSGTDEDPFKPACFVDRADAAAIDLRPDATQVDGYALCASSVISAQAKVISLGNALVASVDGSKRTALAAALKRTITATSVDQLLVEVLSARLKVGTDGKKHIWLVPPGTTNPEPTWQATAWLYDRYGIEDHGMLADAGQVLSVAYHAIMDSAVAQATTLTTETFTASDGDLAGCESRGCTHPWTEPLDTGWTIASNRAFNATVSGGTARLNDSLDTANHEAQATLIGWTVSGGGVGRCGVVARKDNSTTDTFYRFFADVPGTGVLGYESQKRLSGVTTSLATNTQDPVNNDLIKIRVDGDQISGYVNGLLVVGPTTDGTPITGNTYTGLFANSTAGTFTCTFDNFLAADYGLGTGFGPMRRRAG